jgi:hypothetical protein
MTPVSEEIKSIIIAVMYPNVVPDRIYESYNLFHCYFDNSRTSNSINKEGLYKTMYKLINKDLLRP